MDHFRRFPHSSAVRNYDRRFIAGFVYLVFFSTTASAGRSLRSSLSPQSGGRGPWARSTDPAGDSKSAKSTGRIDALVALAMVAVARASSGREAD
jgi:hypothetical protein